MSFWQDLVTAYDANFDALQKYYPLSTTTINNNSDDIINVVLDKNGNLIKFDKILKKGNRENTVCITMPVTESSLSRTSGISPHPVYDQFEYIKGTGKKFDAYIKQLEDFSNSKFSIDEVKAIYNYLSKCQIENDLRNSGVAVKDKTMFIFSVEIPDKPESNTWNNINFFKAWNDYYVDKKCNNEKVYDYITGTFQEKADSHPKKLSNIVGNAKLISDNDKQNFTYRGKFINSDEALSIGYESSQKAHQFLRFLINDSERSKFCENQVIVTYSINSNQKLPNPLNDSKDMLGEFDDIFNLTDANNDLNIDLQVNTGFDFSKSLKDALGGYYTKQSNLLMKNHNRTAVIIFDSATPGRMSITYYKELEKKEYLEKIVDWHESSKWHQYGYDKNDNDKRYEYIGTPSVDNIIKAVYGNPKSNNDVSYNKIKKLARERLLHCIFDGELIPKDFVLNAIRRTSNHVAVENGYEQLLNTTCSLIRKFYKQYLMEDYILALEENRTDRDYLYGRLLGAADKLEEYVNYKEDNDRITNAVRYQNAFSQHPFKTWKIIEESLNPYIQKLRGKRNFSLDEIEKIKSLFQPGDFEKDEPLNGSYLLGYSLERINIKNLIDDAKNAKSNDISDN